MAGERCSKAFWDEVTNRSVEGEAVVCRSGGKTKSSMNLMGKPKQMDINRDRTIVEEDGDVKRYLWECPIAHYDEDEMTITFKDCGYQTNTTKNRLNQVLPNGTRIKQRDSEWYIDGEDWHGEKTITIGELVERKL